MGKHRFRDVDEGKALQDTHPLQVGREYGLMSPSLAVGNRPAWF